MNRLAAVLLVLGAAAIISVARGGHELPIYPSFYPHEIEIRSLAPEDAVQPLRDGMIQAYIGRGLGFSAPTGDLKIAARGGLAQSHPDWSAREADWDAEVTEIDAAELVASAMFTVNGWLAPPWVRTGWFHAERLLADAASEPARKQRIDSDLQRLKAGNFTTLVERINLERDLVTLLTSGCRKLVAGYTVKREYVNVEFSAGIENIGYDSLTGLHSPMFIRTVKLKVFPWNGWLALGIDGKPAAAWNPIGGMTDPFGRLMGFAVGDPALLPSPYEAGWMLNRISDLPSGR